MSNVRALPMVTVSTWATLQSTDITVDVDVIRNGWITIGMQGIGNEVCKFHLPLEAAESVAFQIMSLVQEKLSVRP